MSIKAVLGLFTLGLVTTPCDAQAEPGFCKTPGLERAGLYGGLDTALADDPYDALPNLIAASCGKGGGEAVKRAGEVDAARAKWSKRLDLTEADWNDIAVWSARKQVERNSPSLRTDPKQALSSYDAIDQYANLIPPHVFEPHYIADALGARLTETGRLAYIARCLQSRKNGEWAICQPDLDALDLGKISGELRAITKHTGYERTVIRLEVDKLRKRLAEHSVAMKELARKDPGYAKLFAAAVDARTQWAANPPDAKLLDLALAMDDARVTSSNKAYDGCDARTWAALASAIAKIPAKKFANIKDEPGNPFMTGAIGVLVNDPSAYLAAVAFHTCRASDKPDVLVRFLGASMHRWPGFRGPRTASHTAMLTTNIKLDDRAARIEFPEVRRMFLTGGESTSGGGRGPVSAVKPDGATVKVEFVKKLRKEQVCTDWKDTNRISMISASGTVYYEYNCLKYGSITINDAPSPRTVNARYAAGVKPGTSVSIIEDVVGGVFTKPGGAPTAVFGVAVK